MNITFKRLRSLHPVLCALVLLARPAAAQGADTDAYGGSTRVRWEATGWFRLQQSRGRFWPVTPEGHPFFNLGINHLCAGWTNQQRGDVALTTDPILLRMIPYYAWCNRGVSEMTVWLPAP